MCVKYWNEEINVIRFILIKCNDETTNADLNVKNKAVLFPEFVSIRQMRIRLFFIYFHVFNYSDYSE